MMQKNEPFLTLASGLEIYKQACIFPARQHPENDCAEFIMFIFTS